MPWQSSRNITYLNQVIMRFLLIFFIIACLKPAPSAAQCLDTAQPDKWPSLPVIRSSQAGKHRLLPGLKIRLHRLDHFGFIAGKIDCFGWVIT